MEQAPSISGPRRLTAPRIVLATHNQGKVREIGALLAPYAIAVDTAADHDLPEPEETGTTFEANALLKAEAAAVATGLPALADDSGIAIAALDGAPGIYSARWAGPERDFAMAMRVVEEKLRELGPDIDRTACFVAVLCLAWPDGHHDFFRGEVAGELVWPPRGDMGFGYDPMFVPDGYAKTFGEMSSDEKHGRAHGGLSHRARALSLFAKACLGPGG